jgi:hypothetical protein
MSATKKEKQYLPTPSFPRLNDKLLNTPEAACFLGLSAQTLYKQKSINPGRLPTPTGYKFWRSDLLFSLEVVRLMQSGLSKTDALAQAEINVRQEILDTPSSVPVDATRRSRPRKAGAVK